MNLNALSIALHILAAVLWVGGMFFAHQVLRPVAATQFEPPARLKMWVGVFSRFFPLGVDVCFPTTADRLLADIQTVWRDEPHWPAYTHHARPWLGNDTHIHAFVLCTFQAPERGCHYRTMARSRQTTQSDPQHGRNQSRNRYCGRPGCGRRAFFYWLSAGSPQHRSALPNPEEPGN